jgi:cytochrome c553
MASTILFRRTSAFALAAFAAASLALAGPSAPPAVVVRNCSGCHGIEGRPHLSYVPSLAGQSAKYIEARLQQFRELSSPAVDEAITPYIHRSRASSNDAITPAAAVHMIGIAKSLSENETKAAAAWYSAQTLLPAKSKKGSDFEQGKELYANGRQAQNVPACQSCHGSEAQGTAIAPRLAGQQPAYVLAQLNQFRSGAKPKSPMTQIARSLEQNQIQAIAAYLHSR